MNGHKMYPGKEPNDQTEIPHRLTDKFLDLYNQQLELLTKTGYAHFETTQKIPVSELLAKELDQAVYMANKSMEPEDFGISLKCKRGYAADVLFFIDFVYRPEAETVSPKFIFTFSEGTSLIEELSEKKDLPYPDTLIEKVKALQNRNVARKILNAAVTFKNKLFKKHP